MESRQGQFPATFPDTFKNFFSMLNEEEDHVELFSNLLEDKIIPRSNKCKFRGTATTNISSVSRGGHGCRNLSNTTNFGRSNSFRMPRSENCDDSDTTSTCSSNNATSYSCLLRRNKGIHGCRGGDVGAPGYVASVSTCSNAINAPCTKYSEHQNAPSSSSTPTSMNKCLNDKNNIGISKPTDRIKVSKSPAFRRRRASSIAATYITSEQTYQKDGESMPWGNNELQTRFLHSKSPASTAYNKTVEDVGSNNTVNMPVKQKQRQRTSSMPGENRKPRLADTRRAAIHCADMDLEYYRLRSFSITSHGVCNLGDSMRSRRSRSINSVTSTGTSNSGKDRNNSNASQISANEVDGCTDNTSVILSYKVAMLGDTGVGKTTLTHQFTTSDYICAYDLSLDDDYGQKTVSVLLDGKETDLEIVDHPACEMSTEAFCSTYNIDIFVVVYSVVDRKSFKTAEKVLHYLRDSEMLFTRGAILVGNKTDLERQRQVPRQAGRRLAKEVACKFIETSSGLDHNVNELLVGIVAQVKLNPKRLSNLTARQRLSYSTNIQKHRTSDRPFVKVCKPNPNITTRKVSGPNSAGNAAGTQLDKLSNEKDSCCGVFDDNDSEDDNDDGEKKFDKSDGDDDDDENNDCFYDKFEAKSEGPSCSTTTKTQKSYVSPTQSPKKNSLESDKPVSKISLRTKYFLTSILKFKRSLRVKRRHSNSCSDLFVI
ncbi:sca1 complex protein phr isoform X2 [Bradysia coprophila]|uniref:sca1 complex protein phr isoform X2 n=1 Tax=Bradysia coprophila TaxID=38358 RepID=UPI00187D7AA9|nr:sca1 complex protein phr isoform X2 [Bradysia coprophila]